MRRYTEEDILLSLLNKILDEATSAQPDEDGFVPEATQHRVEVLAQQAEPGNLASLLAELNAGDEGDLDLSTVDDDADLELSAADPVPTGWPPDLYRRAWAEQRRDDRRHADRLFAAPVRELSAVSAPAPPARRDRPPEEGPPEDDAAALARQYAATWNALEAERRSPDPDDMDAAGEELAGTGYHLFKPNGGTWRVVHAGDVKDSEEGVELAVVRAPKGGVTIEGKFYR